MSPTAARQVVLVLVAVVVGAIVLAKGFDSSADVGTIAPDAGTDGGTDSTDGGTDSTDGTATDGTATDGTATDGGIDATATDGTATDGTVTDGTATDGTATDGTATDGAVTDGTATDGTGTDTAAQLHDPAEVRVLVANGAGVQGAAGTASSELILQNYNPLTPTNASSQDYQTSLFYYVPEYEADARRIAEILGGTPDQVQPMPAAPPVTDLLDANVLVVVGADLAGA